MTIAAIGDQGTVQGLALAGAHVVAVDSPEEARRAWLELEPDVVLVLLSASAAAALEDLPDPGRRLRVVLP